MVQKKCSTPEPLWIIILNVSPLWLADWITKQIRCAEHNRCHSRHIFCLTKTICCRCSCCHYLGWSLALSPGISHQGVCAGPRVGVLYPQISFAQVLAVDVAAAGILVAAVRVRVHLCGAAWIPCRRKQNEKGKIRQTRETGEGRGDGVELNMNGSITEVITTDYWLYKNTSVSCPCGVLKAFA